LRVSKKGQKLPYPRGIDYPKNTKLNNATRIEVFIKTELYYKLFNLSLNILLTNLNKN
jgi:hypothetical protein